jgi:hypothetical protein
MRRKMHLSQMNGIIPTFVKFFKEDFNYKHRGADTFCRDETS